MRLKSVLYRCYPRKYLCIQPNVISRCITSSIFCIAFMFYFANTNTYAQENSPSTSVVDSEATNAALALSLITKGDEYSNQKRYTDAIAQYTQSLTYFSSKEHKIQKHLGETYKKLAQSYKRIEDREQTAAYYRKALDIYTALQDKESMARTLNTLAEAERNLGKHVVALDYSTRSLDMHNQLDDPVGHAKALMGAGIIYRYIGRYEKSLEHVYAAYEYYKKVENPGGIAKTSNQMGLIYTRLKQFEQAKSFYQLTIDLPADKIDSNTLAAALREMAVILHNAEDYEAARVMAQNALNVYQRENDISRASLTTRIIANIYRDQQDYSNDILYYRQSLSLAKEGNNDMYQIKAQSSLARVLIGKNTEEAISLLKEALVLSTKIDAKYQTLYIYRLLRKAEKSQGNIVESLHYAEEEISLALILQNEREESQLVLEKANLHSHKMEIELESLREKAMLDQLELVKKNNEIEIAGQARKISELELTKNKYASIALASLLVICMVLVIFIYRRFMHSKKRNKELDYLATHDPLTNTYNRRILFDFLNRDFTDLTLLDEYCIIMADIDNFKDVNDSYGHNVGDSILSGVANTLQGCVRQNDIVARFGGEEFCIILPNTSENDAMHVAETMRQKVESSRFDDTTVTCSFGVTSIKFNAKSPKEFIDQADFALYESKSCGRNQVTRWNKTL